MKMNNVPCQFVVSGELLEGVIIGKSGLLGFVYYICKSGSLIITLPASKVTILDEDAIKPVKRVKRPIKKPGRK